MIALLSFFFTDTASTDIDTLSLHDALPICLELAGFECVGAVDNDLRACETLRQNRPNWSVRSEEHTSELQSHSELVCRLLLEKKKRCLRRGNRAQPW